MIIASRCGWTELFRILRGVRWFETDVSELPVSPIFKNQAVQEEAWSLKMRLIGRSETSFSNHLTPRNNPEDGKIQIHTLEIIILVPSLRILKRVTNSPIFMCVSFVNSL
jgi:hypothetical protein